MPTEQIREDVYENGVLVSSDQKTVDVSQETLNERDLHVKALAALTANAVHLARPSPTVAQNTAQLKAITRQVNGLIRLLLDRLQDVSDT